jgi:hypothetical protein
MSRIVIVGLTALPPSMSRLSNQCGILDISRPYRPLTGRAFSDHFDSLETGFAECLRQDMSFA